MPIDTRDWYREKPIRRTNSPPPPRQSPPRRQGNGGGRFWSWAVLVFALVSLVLVPHILSQTTEDVPGILPTSQFYFLKEIGRGTRCALTFDPVDKASLKLRFADQDALGISAMYSTGDYLHASQLCVSYQDNFFNSLAWTVKACKQGQDVQSMMADLKAAHHGHRLVLADALPNVNDSQREVFLSAITFTSAPFNQVIEWVEGPVEAARFLDSVQKDFSAVDPQLWSTIEPRLQLDENQSLDGDPSSGTGAASEMSASQTDDETVFVRNEENHDTPEKAPVTGFDADTGEYSNYYLGLVYTSEGVLSGQCYGEFIVLINNENAHNPTYNELLAFLRDDDTDKFPYRYYASPLGTYYGFAEDKIDMVYMTDIIDGRSEPAAPGICADFAERLHNHAERVGIRAGYVSIELTGYPDFAGYGIPSDSGHALNVFQTTDRGMVFIDCTGSDGSGPHEGDMIVSELQIGTKYVPDFLFDPDGWFASSMGEVTDVEITWDGEWRP